MFQNPVSCDRWVPSSLWTPHQTFDGSPKPGPRREDCTKEKGPLFQPALLSLLCSSSIDSLDPKTLPAFPRAPAPTSASSGPACSAHG